MPEFPNNQPSHSELKNEGDFGAVKDFEDSFTNLDFSIKDSFIAKKKIKRDYKNSSYSKKTCPIIGHIVAMNDIYFQILDQNPSSSQSFLVPISFIKDIGQISNYFYTLEKLPRKLFIEQLKAYYGTSYSRKKSNVFSDSSTISLSDQLWNYNTRNKNIVKILKSKKSTKNDTSNSHSSLGKLNHINSSEINLEAEGLDSKRVVSSEDFGYGSRSITSTARHSIVADIFNTILDSDDDISFLKDDFHPAQGTSSDDLNTDISIIASINAPVDVVKDLKPPIENVSKKPKKINTIYLMLNKKYTRPSIPVSLSDPISDNLRLFQALVKNAKGPPISVVNDVDDAPPPIDFEFINESRYASDVPRPQELLVSSCACEIHKYDTSLHSEMALNLETNNSSQTSKNEISFFVTSGIFSGYSKKEFKKIQNMGCEPVLPKNGEISYTCTHNPDVGCPYNSLGLLQLPEKNAIYECNWMCSCGPKCFNRLIQRGPQISLQIFRTLNKGWGVRTLETLQKGQFVAEYIGEIITYAEAEMRGKRNDKLGSTYLFDLDFETSEDMNPEFTIDAEKCGNITHFFNHSCDPNLQIRAAYINHCDSRLHQLAFFTKDRIPAGTELTFDYNPSAPFPGDKNYINFNDLYTSIAFSPFRTPNRSARPSFNQANNTSNKATDSASPEPDTVGEEPKADQPYFSNVGSKSSTLYSSTIDPGNTPSNAGSSLTPKKKNTSVAPFIHKGYKCFCGARRCRGFVFLA
ncbi:hypothetical protein BB560_007260 [Smittium megazygosporum]|uniref:SET domain-containing protein n=1 Tax=Smittium megazygosporum TaxID=133381 RepID=A0A2T9XXI7_9FUNG|nr:hypothetical protein BB560_007260 [Smittium megazygosporum]